MLGPEAPPQRSSVSCAHLSQDGEVWLVCCQRQHDKVSIQAIHHMLGVGVPALTSALLPDKGHCLVLTLTRNIGVRQDHLEHKSQQHSSVSMVQWWALGFNWELST